MSSLRFEGPATIQSAAAAQARLSEALARGGDVSVDCAGLDEVDVAFLQVLVAARRSADAIGVSLRLAPPPSQSLRSAFDRAGVAPPPGLLPE